MEYAYITLQRSEPTLVTQGRLQVGSDGWEKTLAEMIAEAKYFQARREIELLHIEWDAQSASYLRKQSIAADIPHWLNREFKLGGFTRDDRGAIFLAN